VPGRARLDAEGRGDPILAKLEIPYLHRRGDQVVVGLAHVRRSKGELAILDQGSQVGAVLGVGFPELFDEQHLLKGVAETRVLFRDLDRRENVRGRLPGVGSERVMPVGIPMREWDEKDRTLGARDQRLRCRVEVDLIWRRQCSRRWPWLGRRWGLGCARRL